MQLFEITTTSSELSAVSARGAKVELLAALLRRAPVDEVSVVVSWLTGELPQRQIGVGWASLRDAPEPADQPTLTVAGVDATFSAIKATGGAGSQAVRRRLLADLFGAATEPEQRFLRALLSAGLRQGALAGVMTDAIARAAALPLVDVRRAAMLRGDLAAVAAAALSGGVAEIASFRLEVGRPVSPMLAQTAADVDEALTRLGGRAMFEAKLDGARVQIHRSGADVAIFTRSLDDVTTRMPEIVATIRALPVDDLVVDGEVIAIRPDGRPHPFQITASQVGASNRSEHGPPLSVYVFDVLRSDGRDLLDAPASERVAVLTDLLPPPLQVARVFTDEPSVAQAFLDATLAAGHEGVVAKSLTAPYEAGRRGAGWLKIKPVHTLDLVVLAVEWGSGRRTGKLSNIHLGARAADGRFVMLGKTFKGMTDAMLAWQTDRFRELADGPLDGWVVALRPEQVVEIAFDGVQRSSRYPGGVALRFARVLRYRDDKPVDEIDTIETVQAMLAPG